jgi:hypothetical protein
MFANSLKSGYLLPVLAVAYALFTALVMIDAGEPARPRWWLGFSSFLVWGLMPLVGFLWLARRWRDWRHWLVVAAFVAVFAFSVWGIYSAFYVEEDAQSGIVFAILPVYQWLAALAAGVVAAIVGKLRGDPGPEETAAGT